MSEREDKGPRGKVQEAFLHQRTDVDLPGNGWEARAIFIYEVAPCIEDPAVMKGQQSMPCSSRIVLPVLTVCILQWGKLIFSEHFIHHKLPRVEPYRDRSSTK